MRKKIQCMSFCLMIAWGVPSWGYFGMTAAAGYGTASIKPIRLGLQHHWHNLWREQCSWQASGYWDLNGYYLPGKRGSKPDSNKQASAVAFSPVLRFMRQQPLTSKYYPYIDVGIGISYFNKREIGGRNLGMRYQFEDQIGIGILIGTNKQFDLSYRFVHFSNGHLGDSNHGLNLQMLSIGYWFNV